MRRVLFAAAELQPFIKVGGLGDVAGSLPRALAANGEDIRIFIPGHGPALKAAGLPVRTHALGHEFRGLALLEYRLPDSDIPVWILRAPGFSDRRGPLYAQADGTPYADDAKRFALFARVAAAIADDTLGLDWHADVVHCNDWHTGLVPVYMLLRRVDAASIFTIHNLAYQGLFPAATLEALGLPGWLWHFQALEFNGKLSFIKGGLNFADRITTVSPTYAREIRTPAYGEGLDGLLNHRADALQGILNGIDTEAWNPACDPHLTYRYGPERLRGKASQRRLLREEFGLPARRGHPLFAMVTRLTYQKGIDILLEALPQLLERKLQLLVLGTGAEEFEQMLREFAALHPRQIAVNTDYDEALAHRIYAGADMLLMPSRFEPCGLSQMYALRYGAVPIVRRCGGLADTVVDAADTANHPGEAETGFSFQPTAANALLDTVDRACTAFAERGRWRAIMRSGMNRDFSWTRSAASYQQTYTAAITAHCMRRRQSSSQPVGLE